MTVQGQPAAGEGGHGEVQRCHHRRPEVLDPHHRTTSAYTSLLVIRNIFVCDTPVTALTLWILPTHFLIRGKIRNQLLLLLFIYLIFIVHLYLYQIDM